MIALIVRIIHLLFISVVLTTPFTDNIPHLQFYSIFIPFLFLHWTLNDDTCALTMIEKTLTDKKDNKDTFIGRIIGPIYKMDDSDMSKMNVIITFCLWFYVMYRLNKNSYAFFK